jgi:N-methylhydantoinase B
MKHQADPIEYDPVAVEIIWNRLVAVVNEAASVLVRSAFSTTIIEANDYASATFFEEVSQRGLETR